MEGAEDAIPFFVLVASVIMYPLAAFQAKNWMVKTGLLVYLPEVNDVSIQKGEFTRTTQRGLDQGRGMPLGQGVEDQGNRLVLEQLSHRKIHPLTCSDHEFRILLDMADKDLLHEDVVNRVRYRAQQEQPA